jgi:tetratricopeptide (TPR) repeat protein
MRLLLIAFMVCGIALGEGRKGAAFEAGRRAYEAGKYARSLDLFARAIGEAGTPSERNQAYYFQGLVLYEMGYLYSAYISFRNVLLQADNNNKQIYEKAIKNAVLITDRLGIVERIGGALEKLPANFVPSSVSDMAHYSIGVYYFSKGDNAQASQRLKSVHPESQFYLKSLFHLGVLSTATGNYSEASFYFKKVVAASRTKPALFPLGELSRLNLARVTYASGDIEGSIEHYSKFLSSSPHWLTVLFEASWPLMRVNDTTVSLGNLHTILSPFYREDLVGEGYVLRASILFTLCKYEEMRQTLAQFFKIYDPVIRDMQETNRNSSPESMYSAFVSQKGLSSAFINYANRDQGITNKMKVVQMLKEERQNLSQFRTNEQMRRMSKLIEEAEQYFQKQIGATLAKLHARKLQDLLEQREQANYLKVEIVTGEKELIEGQKGLPPKRVVDVETTVAPGYRFWPFNGEYWDDELGAYVYTTESACVN